MGWLVRPRPCPCGSGRVARDCCGRFRRLSEADVARAHVHRQARAARELLYPFSAGGMEGLRHELSSLPAAQDRVGSALQGRAATEVAKLVSAAARRDQPAGEALIGAVTARAGLQLARVALAKAVMALREDGEIDEHLTAAAIVDLDGPASVLLAAAVSHDAAVARARRQAAPDRRQRATVGA
jgi:hypothetical protein